MKKLLFFYLICTPFTLSLLAQHQPSSVVFIDAISHDTLFVSANAPPKQVLPTSAAPSTPTLLPTPSYGYTTPPQPHTTLAHEYNDSLLFRTVAYHYNGGNGKKAKAAAPANKPTDQIAEELMIHQYIEKYKAIAISEMQRTQVPASITLAQGILESAAGSSYLTRKANNHFGIMVHGNWRGGRISFLQNGIKRTYRSYNSNYASYIDHSNFLGRDRYDFLFEQKNIDYQKWAYGLAKAGYAEDPNYPEKIIRLIKRHSLHQYDNLHQTPEHQARCGEKVFATPAVYNGIKTVIFDCDVSLQQIERGYKVKLSQLMQYNKLQADQIVPANTMVFLEAPKRRSPSGIEYHLVKPNETIESIAHLYAMTSEKLYKLNKIMWGTQPKAGEQLSLRTKVKTAPATFNTQRYIGNKRASKPTTITHTVKEGDTLYSISRRYNISVADLRATNDLPSDTIKLRQKLKVRAKW